MAADKYRAADPACSYAIGPVPRLAWKRENQPPELEPLTGACCFFQNDVNVDVTEESQNETVMGTKQKGSAGVGMKESFA